MAPPRDRRPGFSRRAQYGLFAGYVIAVTGCLLAAVLLMLSKLDPPVFAVLRAAAAEVTTPVSGGASVVTRGLLTAPETLSTLYGIRQENARLRKDIDGTRRTLMHARTLAYDNRRLRALLALRDREGVTVVSARLVSSTASSTRRFGILNAGTWQGVHSGQPVLGPEGLIGRILEVGPNSARVLLLTDAESVVPVRRTRDGLPALAAGRGDGLVDIRSVASASGAFAAGDVFVTSGTGGIYSPDVPVARVLHPARDVAIARSFEQPDTLDFAVVQQPFAPPPPPLPVPPVTGKRK